MWRQSVTVTGQAVTCGPARHRRTPTTNKQTHEHERTGTYDRGGLHTRNRRPTHCTTQYTPDRDPCGRLPTRALSLSPQQERAEAQKVYTSRGGGLSATPCAPLPFIITSTRRHRCTNCPIRWAGLRYQRPPSNRSTKRTSTVRHGTGGRWDAVNDDRRITPPHRPLELPHVVTERIDHSPRLRIAGALRPGRGSSRLRSPGPAHQLGPAHRLSWRRLLLLLMTRPPGCNADALTQNLMRAFIMIPTHGCWKIMLADVPLSILTPSRVTLLGAVMNALLSLLKFVVGIVPCFARAVIRHQATRLASEFSKRAQNTRMAWCADDIDTDKVSLRTLFARFRLAAGAGVCAFDFIRALGGDAGRPGPRRPSPESPQPVRSSVR